MTVALYHSTKLNSARLLSRSLLDITRSTTPPSSLIHATRLSLQSRPSSTSATLEDLSPSSHYPRPMASNASSSSQADSDSEIHSRKQQNMLASRRAKENNSAAPKNFETTGKRGMFPLGYKEGFSQWWAGLPAAQTEHTVLSFIPYLQRPPTHTKTGSAPPSISGSTASVDDTKITGNTPSRVTSNSVDDPHGPRKWHSSMIPLPGKNRAINEFSIERVGEKVEQNLVILHGYGAGLGFFYKNFEALSRKTGWQTYALDMLGMGRSSRPPFKMHGKTRPEQITEAETWFIDALEEWRVVKKIDRFTLLGHSMGGYMAVAYALKYPGHLNKLILASPVGIPEDPYAVNAAMPEPAASTMGNEFTQDQDTETVKNNNPPTDNNNFLNARKKTEKDAAKSGNTTDTATPPPRKPLPKWLTYLWDANISPFSFVRWSGPFGPRLVSGWTSRRFSHLPPLEAQALHDYAYSLFKLRGSGEYALAYILAPGAFARSPLIRRIQGVGRQMMTSAQANGINSVGSSTSPKQEVRENGIPVVLMYGENDWMDVSGGRAAKVKMDDEKKKLQASMTEEEKRRDNGEAKVTIIKKAGHHVYLDGWEEFNDVMLGEMEDVERREERLKRS